MKKVIILIVIAAIVALSIVAMAACTDKKDTVSVEKITAVVVDNTVFYVGDAFDTAKFTVTATLSDKTEVKMSNMSGVFYDKSGLKLVNNKYSEAGKVTLKIIYLEKYEAEVEITVNPVQ